MRENLVKFVPDMENLYSQGLFFGIVLAILTSALDTTVKPQTMSMDCTMNFMGGINNIDHNGVNYTINGRGHLIQMINDKWVIDGVQMTMDEMIAKGIATKEGERADGKNINIIVNGDVERIDGNVNLLGVKGNVRRINTSHGDITVNGDVDGDVHTNYGDITCGNIDGDARTNFGNIYRK